MRILAVPLLLAIFAPAFAAESDTEQSQLARLLGSDAAGFPRATTPRAFTFPDDHGPHPEYRNEWWYITGNLDSDDGKRYGFELTIFRFALTPTASPSTSGWRSNQVYIAHFAVTDADGQEFYVAERFSRGALGLAGASAEPFRVWVDDWEIAGDAGARSNHWTLSASDAAFGLELQLVAQKGPVLNGIDGLSQKSAEPGNASYYYSITRWQTEGQLRIGDRQFTVSGLSWLDREWSSSALAADQKGWDWFALQLSDGSELMFYNLRKTDGSQDIHSAGTWVAADGSSRHLQRDEVSLRVLDQWSSPKGGVYPSRWELAVPGEALSLVVEPVLDDQELFTTVRYWEGAVEVRGTRDGARVSGRGYVELTGYAQ